MNDPTNAFRDALAAAGLPFTGSFNADGKIHRYKAGEDKEANSWYLLHLAGDGFAAGAFGCWKRQISEKWHSAGTREYTPAEKTERDRLWREARAQHAAEQDKRHQAAAARAAELFAESNREASEIAAHPYLKTKAVQAHGDLTMYGDLLQVPFRDSAGRLWSIQHIFNDGSKRYLSGGRIRGCFHTLSDRKDGPIIIAEGYATAATCHEATGYATVMAGDCGNLRAVYDALRALYPGRLIILAADNDRFTPGNPGLSKAKEIRGATKDVHLTICLPMFAEDSTAGTDFNDLAAQDGLPIVADNFRWSLPYLVKPLTCFNSMPDEDPNELIRHRWLCRGGLMLLCAPSGVGKSSFILQWCAALALALDFFGITGTKRFKILLIQAENDDGDLSEMRDGIMRGMELTPAQRNTFMRNVVVHTTNGETGLAFTALLRTLLEYERPDFVIIDPALAYVGGDVRDQTVVGDFLRSQLLPVLALHKVGCILVHHTNKPPSGKEKANWQHDDFMYLGSGSAEFANVSRAVLTIQGTGTAGIYRLHAAKRGARLAWHDPDGNLIYSKLIGHSRTPKQIHWRDAEESELPEQDEKTSRPQGRPSVDHWPAVCSTWNGEPTPPDTLKQFICEITGLSIISARRLYREWMGNHLRLTLGNDGIQLAIKNDQ